MHKLFIDSRGAQAAIGTLHADLIELISPNKDLKTFPPLQKNLKTIDVSGNKLESLPDAICELPCLQKLVLDNNVLNKLPNRLRQLQKLTTLSFSGNQVSELPDGLEDLSRLESLVMNDNRIRRLPARLGMLKKLKKLFLHSNQLAQLPSEMACLEHLRELSLEWFMYMLPPMPKVLRESKSQAVIDHLKQFCRTA